MLKEFKEFALRGNVIDMAVGIIIGGAFTTVVRSLVSDIIMPPLGLILGEVDLTRYLLVLKQGTTAGPYSSPTAAQGAGAVTLNYGLFVDAGVSLAIVAFAMFIVVRYINKLKRKQEAPPPPPAATKECPYCASVISIKAARCPNCISDLAPAAA